MSGEKKYEGIRAGDAWIAAGPLTRTEAEELIEGHMQNASVDVSFWLEEEGDHLVASFLDRTPSADRSWIPAPRPPEGTPRRRRGRNT